MPVSKEVSKARTNRRVLPQNPAEFESLVDDVIVAYGFPDRSTVEAVAAMMIRRLQADEGYTTLFQLANAVRNATAKHVATHVGHRVQHESQIDLVVQQIVADPLDQQAIDNLEAAALAGSDYANAALVRLGREPIATKIATPIVTESGQSLSQSDVKVNVP